MPNLDVSFVTQDPMLADTFTVTRRKDVVGSNGRTTIVIDKVFTRIMGVVTPESPADMIRRDDSQSSVRTITIATAFMLQGEHTGHQSDIVTWDGTQYTVKTIAGYRRFGRGMCLATATSMTATDAAN